MNIPAAFEFKRVFFSNATFFNVLGDLGDFRSAPVYYFPQSDAFNRIGAWERYLDPSGLELRLPHAQVIFEVREENKFQSLLVLARQRGSEVEAFMMMKPLEHKEWYAPVVRVDFCPGRKSNVKRNPKYCPAQQDEYSFSHIVGGIVVGALAILDERPEIQNVSMPLPRRRIFEKAGVSGWIWHTVKIDPAKIQLRGSHLGGTHAAPRWHIRRGHWRTIGDGRRVFVRECQVGEMARGGGVKDYEVAVA